jgi:hypothetical protein
MSLRTILRSTVGRALTSFAATGDKPKSMSPFPPGNDALEATRDGLTERVATGTEETICGVSPHRSLRKVLDLRRGESTGVRGEAKADHAERRDRP